VVHISAIAITSVDLSLFPTGNGMRCSFVQQLVLMSECNWSPVTSLSSLSKGSPRCYVRVEQPRKSNADKAVAKLSFAQQNAMQIGKPVPIQASIV
jgi:hypothetical protein